MTATTTARPAARRVARFATLLAALALAAAARAAPIYLIDATTDGLAPDAGFTNVGFSLTYEDSNGDMAFALPELLAFTGVSDGSSHYFGELLAVPVLPGLVGSGNEWVFGDGAGGDWHVAASVFTPFTSGPLAGSVPEPGSFGLAAAGLLLLGIKRRAGRCPRTLAA